MAKYPAKGAKVYFDTNNPPTTLIGQMGDSEFDTGERDGLVDATTHDTSLTRDKIDNKLKEPPKLDGEIIYDPADVVHESLRAKQKTYATGYCKVELPDAGAAQWVFPARVRTFGVGLPVADKMAAKISIEGMGDDTFTA